MENPQKTKIETQEIIAAIHELYKLPFCQHCQINPEATKPYIKRTSEPITELTDKLLKNVTKETSIPAECFICLSITRFVKLSSAEQKRELEKAMRNKN